MPRAADLAADLERFLRGEPVLARRQSFAYLAGKFIRRYQARLIVAAVVAVLVLSGTVAAFARIDNAKITAQNAEKKSADDAQAAKDAEGKAKASAEDAKNSEAKAKESEAKAKESEAKAKASEVKAKESENTAKASENKALEANKKLMLTTEDLKTQLYETNIAVAERELTLRNDIALASRLLDECRRVSPRLGMALLDATA